jgi:hypothetical protein
VIGSAQVNSIISVGQSNESLSKGNAISIDLTQISIIWHYHAIVQLSIMSSRGIWLLYDTVHLFISSMAFQFRRILGKHESQVILHHIPAQKSQSQAEGPEFARI